MSLTQELAEFKSKFVEEIPQNVLQAMESAGKTLLESGLADRSLNEGSKMPEFELPNAAGQAVRLSTLLANGPVVVTFYRGGWCPYCNMELRALQNALPEMKSLGASLLAISPETPDNSLSTKEKSHLEFEVLSDVGNRVAKQFGLVFQLPENLRPIYQSFGIDIAAYNGDENFELPLPATYVVDSKRQIVKAFVDVDYTQRLDPADIVAALKAL